VDFSELSITLKKATENSAAVTMNYGSFVNTIIDFLIISFSIFLVVKQFERFRKKEERKTKLSPEAKLLTEIRDLLKK